MNAETGTHIYKTGALFDVVPEDFVEQAQLAGASEVHLRYDSCTVNRVEAIHNAGMSSMAWFRGPVGMTSDVNDRFWDVGNEDESCYQALIDTGVQQMCVNRPDVLMTMLQTKSQRMPLGILAPVEGKLRGSGQDILVGLV